MIAQKTEFPFSCREHSKKIKSVYVATKILFLLLRWSILFHPSSAEPTPVYKNYLLQSSFVLNFYESQFVYEPSIHAFVSVIFMAAEFRNDCG